MYSSRTAWNLATNRFTETLEHCRASGAKLVDLTVSNPTTCGLAFDQTAIMDSLSNPLSLRYESEAKGLLSARQAVAAYYGALPNPVSIDPKNLVLTTGTSEAYSFAFRLLCEAGDEVLVPRPSYPLLEFLASIQDVRLVPYSLIYDHGWQIDFHSLSSVISPLTKAVVVVHPNNPTGSYVKPEEAAELSSICAQNQLAMISDEVFLDYSLKKAPVNSFASNYDALTFTLSGLSKICGLPQMKVAWCAVSGPDPKVKEAVARLEVIADTYLSMNTPVQLAVPQLLQTRHSFQSHLMQRLCTNLAELDRQLRTQDLCRRLETEGGWYATLRVPSSSSDEDIAIELMKRHSVIVHPGHFFDFESEGYLILSLMTPAVEFKEGVRCLLGYF